MELTPEVVQKYPKLAEGIRRYKELAANMPRWKNISEAYIYMQCPTNAKTGQKFPKEEIENRSDYVLQVYFMSMDRHGGKYRRQFFLDDLVQAIKTRRWRVREEQCWARVALKQGGVNPKREPKKHGPGINDAAKKAVTADPD